MTISISIQLESMGVVPVKQLQETAKYLLAIAGEELKNDTSTSSRDVGISVGSDGSRKDVDTDVDGKTWDYKIHSSNKSKNKDGRWKLKRNTEIMVTQENDVSEVETPLIPAAVPPPLPVEDLLPKLMSKITEKIVSGKMTHVMLSNLLRETGIPDVPSIQNYPHLFALLIEKIGV